jgi:hypothetical protein
VNIVVPKLIIDFDETYVPDFECMPGAQWGFATEIYVPDEYVHRDSLEKVTNGLFLDDKMHCVIEIDMSIKNNSVFYCSPKSFSYLQIHVSLDKTETYLKHPQFNPFKKRNFTYDAEYGEMREWEEYYNPSRQQAAGGGCFIKVRDFSIPLTIIEIDKRDEKFDFMLLTPHPINRAKADGILS